ncbi:MAG: hypothetical protein HY691_20590, partial [Chloroflexi bacterium]|nr:hypothetical protein [Chloroflexota bacterium]
LVRLRLLRFRLETFGLYYPSLPHERPWRRVAPAVALLVARRLPGYLRWIGDLRAVARRGAAGWWRRHQRPAERARWDESLRELNR